MHISSYCDVIRIGSGPRFRSLEAFDGSTATLLTLQFCGGRMYASASVPPLSQVNTFRAALAVSSLANPCCLRSRQ
jgi:hypothetical protein